MTVIIPRRRIARILRWTQRLLFVFAACMLAYCGFFLMEAWVFQRVQDRQFEQLLSGRKAEDAVGRHAGFPAAAPPAAGALIGRMEIPRLGMSSVVIEGTTNRVLRRALGHIQGTAFPGLPGNVGVSGHRDTFFRPLRNIRLNDTITFTTLAGDFQYRVVSTKVVAPGDVAVLDSSGIQTLTLVTCYPFYFVGSAPGRFIVRAERVGNKS